MMDLMSKMFAKGPKGSTDKPPHSHEDSDEETIPNET